MKKWTDNETEYLAKNYEYGNVDEIAKKLRKSKNSIYAKANLLGLKKALREEDRDYYAEWWENIQVLNKIRIKLGKAPIPESKNPYGEAVR
ncbi:MAG: hypothetical protein Q4D26_12150 [Clostridia bacterium]|nr:hypothetical protein [Clostridia bacterium]